MAASFLSLCRKSGTAGRPATAKVSVPLSLALSQARVSWARKEQEPVTDLCSARYYLLVRCYLPARVLAVPSEVVVNGGGWIL